MNDNKPRTEFERRVIRELHSSTQEWTSECLSAEELLNLVDEAAPYAEMERMRSHTATCAYCCQEYIDLSRSLLEADQLRAALGERAPLTSVPVQLQAVPLIPTPAQSSPPDGQRAALPPSISRWKMLLRPPMLVGYAVAAASAFLLAYVGAILPLQRQAERLRQEQSIARAVPELKAQLQQERNAREQEAQQNKQHLVEMQSQANRQAAVAEAQKREFEAKTQKAQQKIFKLTQRANQHNDGWLSPADRIALQADTKLMGQLAAQTILAGEDHSIGLNKIKGLQPSQTRIETLRPYLRWEAVPDATVYKISLAPVLPDRTLGDLALQEKETLGTELLMPTDLKYGQVYEWQVEAYKAGETKPFAESKARFAILASVNAARLALLHLRLGDFYEKSGLVEDARREWQAIPLISTCYQAAQKRLSNLNAVFSRNP